MPAFEWTSSEPLEQDADFTVGSLFQITSNTPFGVTHLGVYDSLGDGLKEAHDIGLRHDDGTSLFGPSEAYRIGPDTGDLEGHFRYIEIASPIRLDPGKYVVAASWQTGVDDYAFGPIPKDDFIETFKHENLRESAFAEGSDLKFPDNYNNAIGPNAIIGLFGANLELTDNPNPVPEPQTMLLLGIGLIGLAGFGRRRIKNK
jgi:hypothetical protein